MKKLSAKIKMFLILANVVLGLSCITPFSAHAQSSGLTLVNLIVEPNKGTNITETTFSMEAIGVFKDANNQEIRKPVGSAASCKWHFSPHNAENWLYLVEVGSTLKITIGWTGGELLLPPGMRQKGTGVGRDTTSPTSSIHVKVACTHEGHTLQSQWVQFKLDSQYTVMPKFKGLRS